MASAIDNEASERLKALAETEVAAAKARHKTRTTAAGRFAAATAKLADAEATWAAAQGEANTDKAGAVADLLGSGMKPGDVAELLGIGPKDVRALRAAAPATATEETAVPGPSANGTGLGSPFEG